MLPAKLNCAAVPLATPGRSRGDYSKAWGSTRQAETRARCSEGESNGDCRIGELGGAYLGPSRTLALGIFVPKNQNTCYHKSRLSEIRQRRRWPRAFRVRPTPALALLKAAQAPEPARQQGPRGPSSARHPCKIRQVREKAQNGNEKPLSKVGINDGLAPRSFGLAPRLFGLSAASAWGPRDLWATTR